VTWLAPKKERNLRKTWFVTGTTRGLGAEIVRAALEAGDCVVATGRDRHAVLAACGEESDRMLAVTLDVTDARQVHDAVATAIAHFGAIDVLVNNAGYGQMGFFEENTIDDARLQFETNFFGALRVIWAVLPLMRAARKGRIFNISSLAGIRGAATGSLYCGSKFALEGVSESLAQEIAPLGLSLTLVEPGLFRTDFLSDKSARFGNGTIPEYAETSSQLRDLIDKQAGDSQVTLGRWRVPL
jgi:NAD(P)-dependent dehydrogenase (short-subunit alcohol dehydrogenase family)